MQFFYTSNEGAPLQVIADVRSTIQSYKLNVSSKLFSKSVTPGKYHYLPPKADKNFHMYKKNFDAWLALAYPSFVVAPPMAVVDIADESKVSGQNVCSFSACLKVFQMSQKL